MIAGINNIQKLLSDVLKRFDISDTVEIRYSNIENVDVQCNNLVRYSKNPDILEIKKEIISNVKKSQLVKHIEINDQNFININLSDEYLYKFSQNLKKRISHNKINSVIIDYGGPNIGKDLHVGHIRTLNIGRALYNILELSGSKVISDIHFGDWGMPVAQIIAYIEFKKLDINEIDFQDLEVIYPKANQLSRENEDFYDVAKGIAKNLNSGNKDYLKQWEKIYNIAIPNIKRLLEKLGHNFDWYYGESSVVKETDLVVSKALKNGKIKEDSGALISTQESDPPILITKSDGSYLYLTTDLGTVVFRENKSNFDKYIYVVDSRQKNHFEQLFKTIEYFDLSKSDFYHVGFGTINGADNKPFRTRDGGVYKLSLLFEDIKEKLRKYNSDDSILNTLTNTVLAYSDLLPNRNQNYVFDVDNFTDINGRTGIYIQYAQVRAKKLLENSNFKNDYSTNLELSSEERNLLLMITKFDNFFNLSLSNMEPHHLAEYLYNICKAFNSFYTNIKIFGDDIPNDIQANRLKIVEEFYNTVILVFKCLGIEPVNKM
tara:strand:+ start:1977 stop:3614 length:1638 start_codon:yes stop_codon:yes gene_type:complete